MQCRVRQGVFSGREEPILSYGSDRISGILQHIVCRKIHLIKVFRRLFFHIRAPNILGNDTQSWNNYLLTFLFSCEFSLNIRRRNIFHNKKGIAGQFRHTYRNILCQTYCHNIFQELFSSIRQREKRRIF